ncbi:hypothetical protein CDO52_22625 [Nocardiopsis gilva YIM 90087]|uniref:Protein kinase domain-containing protein n=1 Tax=Nocardiopsis gilva YIM 90087 TaxID=1235441 RepID=A0A223SAW9_9ACTN|nr:serine/threonine-protein kinase [Nocardiopsis gilva]ASU85213.1 hypothetical protein CDO52_22625 [Nocardiopsis gilva YIM 90087]
MAMTAGFPEGEELPERIGPYVIRRRIGQGGMGVVYQAEDPRTDRLVAIKVLRPEVAGDHIARARLDREVATMRLVHSRNVAEVIDADTSARLPWVVTEYVPGPTLDSTVTDHGPLRGRALTRFVAGLAQAIDDIHAADVIHRDLKPGNVIISNGEPIVIDFGIAHAVDGAKLTQTGTFVGTPSYLSPEVIEGTDLGPATDVHAWGATVAFAATGEAPYGAGSFEVIFFRILNGEINIDGVPEALRPMIMRAVSRDMASRPTAAQLVAEARQLNLDLPWTEDAAHASTGLTGSHTVHAPMPERERGAASAGGSGGGTGGLARGGGGRRSGSGRRGRGTGRVRHGTRRRRPEAPRTPAVPDAQTTRQAPPSGDAGAATELAPTDETGRTDWADGADRANTADTTDRPDRTMVAGNGGLDQTTRAVPVDEPQTTGYLPPDESEPENDRSGPHTMYYDSTLRPEEFRDILTPVDQNGPARRADHTATFQGDDYEDEPRRGLFDRIKGSSSDRLSDYLGSRDDDGYDEYDDAEPRRLPSLILIPVLLLLAGLGLLVPWVGLISGVLVASVLGALSLVKAEHARRLQTRGPRSSDSVVIALSMPWALIRNLGTTLLYGLGYLLGGIVLGLIIVFTVGGSGDANTVGAYAIVVVVLGSFLGPNGRGARVEAVRLVDKINIRNVYVYWGVIAALVLFTMLVYSFGLTAAAYWGGAGPADWFASSPTNV